jgi:hypothetical protein
MYILHVPQQINLTRSAIFGKNEVMCHTDITHSWPTLYDHFILLASYKILLVVMCLVSSSIKLYEILSRRNVSLVVP